MSRPAEGRAKAEARERPAEAAASRVSRGVWEQISTLLVAVLIALAIRAFVIEPYRIPSGSMFPTLLVGDHLFVNKFIYGIKLPFTDLRLPGLREPERGDIAVFTVAQRGSQTYPADRRPDLPREEFVKRIIGAARRSDQLPRRPGLRERRAGRDAPSGRDLPGRRGQLPRRERGDARRPQLPDPRRSRT